MAGIFAVLSPNTTELITGLLSGLISAIGAWVYHWLVRRPGARISWSVLTDAPINKAQDPQHTGQRRPGQHVWNISYESDATDEARRIAGMGGAPGTLVLDGTTTTLVPAVTDRDARYQVPRASIVNLELRNTRHQAIPRNDWKVLSEDGTHDFRADFPGRKIINYKVRDNDDYRDEVDEYLRTHPVVPGKDSSVMLLPPLNFMPHDESNGWSGKITLVFLLMNDSGADPKSPYITGGLTRGKIAGRSGPGVRRRNWSFLVAIALVVALILGGVGGAIESYYASQDATPKATCAQGAITVAGSTAFAPIMAQVATAYELQCPDAAITVVGDDSGMGLRQLENPKSTTAIAMYDGLPSAMPSSADFPARPVGDVIMAVVGNEDLPPRVFDADTRPGQDNGLQASDITQIFASPFAPGGALTGLPVKTIGRVGSSGTRQAFVTKVAGGNQAATGSTRSASTTMELLGYVNSTPYAIGYAEADALPFFPDVREIAVNGHLPTRQNALDGDYSFLATEHLFTRGQPAGLAKDLIDFLTSPAENNQLKSSSFISCADLAASTTLKDDCPAS